MKMPVVITTIICGTFLIVAPLIYRCIGTIAAAFVLSHMDKSFMFEGGVSYWYDAGCLVIGAVLLVVGVRSALQRGT